jgi:hypothetical protein
MEGPAENVPSVGGGGGIIPTSKAFSDYTLREKRKRADTHTMGKGEEQLIILLHAPRPLQLCFFRFHHHPNGGAPTENISWLLMMKTADEIIDPTCPRILHQTTTTTKKTRQNFSYFLKFNINRGRQMRSTNGVTEGLCCVVSTRFCFSLQRGHCRCAKSRV